MNNAMNIRTARLDDVPVITDYNLRLAKETENLELDLPTVTAGVKALVSEASRGTYYVAEAEGKVMGQLCITYEWSDWRNGNIWWFQSVYVQQEFRGQGVFTALFEHIESLARANPEVCGLRLYMEQENHRARRAYGKLGMEQTHYQVFEKLLR